MEDFKGKKHFLKMILTCRLYLFYFIFMSGKLKIEHKS